MNIFSAIKNWFSNEKTLTSGQWKKGMIIGDYYNNKGATNPFKDSSLVYVAASKISENLPQAPLNFYKISTKQKLGLDSPIVKLFLRPNENDTYFTFFEASTLYLALYGETFIYSGQSVGQAAGISTLPGFLQILIPTRMQHEVNSHGIVTSWLYDTGYDRLELSAEDVIQIKFPNPYNTIRGLPPITSAQTDIDSDYLAGRFSRAFFRNGASPGIIFSKGEDDDSSDDETKKFIKDWNQIHQGADNQGKTTVLNPGMDVKKVGLTQEEMDYVKQREFNTNRILSVLGVPPPMAGFYEQATYGNVRTAKKIFWNETIKAYARRYESALNNFFLPKYAPGISCKFNFSDIDELKHDAKETAELVNVYANHGVAMNVLNDAFELPWEHQEGLDEGYQPMTMLPVGTNFIEIQQNDAKIEAAENDKKQITTTTQDIFKEFETQLHNYLYTQRKKILKIVGNDKEIDNSFWQRENSRLITKFGIIYGKYNKTPIDLVKINLLNKKLIKDQGVDEIKIIYNNFFKKIKKTGKSRIEMISIEECNNFLEQNDIGDIKNEI